jgi:hypothetical protein
MRRIKSAQNVDIPAVLQRLGVDVRKATGREIWACCPLHSVDGKRERTPSFRIRNEQDGEKHGFYQCFGSCNGERRSGSVFKLVELVLGLESRTEAKRWINGEKLEREREAPKRIVIATSEPKVAKRGVERPIGVIVAPVARWPQMAREYLDKRGIPTEQAERWGCGYGKFGKYANRIFFPAYDRQGRLLNFTTRTYVDAVPKFKEPTEGSGAEKTAVFGELAWPEPDKRQVVVVLESAINVLAAEREVPEFCHGAIFGSEVLPGHFLRFGTFKCALVASDPDPAGDKFYDAMYKGLVRHAKVQRVEIPEGTDAADLARDAPGILRRRILEAAHRAEIDLK